MANHCAQTCWGLPSEHEQFAFENKMENRQHRSGNFPRQLSAEWTKRRGFPSPKLLQRQRAHGFWGFECIMNMPECAKWSPAPPARGLCPGEVEYPTSFHMQSWVVAV